MFLTGIVCPPFAASFKAMSILDSVSLKIKVPIGWLEENVFVLRLVGSV